MKVYKCLYPQQGQVIIGKIKEGQLQIIPETLVCYGSDHILRKIEFSQIGKVGQGGHINGADSVSDQRKFNQPCRAGEPGGTDGRQFIIV